MLLGRLPPLYREPVRHQQTSPLTAPAAFDRNAPYAASPDEPMMSDNEREAVARAIVNAGRHRRREKIADDEAGQNPSPTEVEQMAEQIVLAGRRRRGECNGEE